MKSKKPVESTDTILARVLDETVVTESAGQGRARTKRELIHAGVVDLATRGHDRAIRLVLEASRHQAELERSLIEVDVAARIWEARRREMRKNG